MSENRTDLEELVEAYENYRDTLLSDTVVLEVIERLKVAKRLRSTITLIKEGSLIFTRDKGAF